MPTLPSIPARDRLLKFRKNTPKQTSHILRYRKRTLWLLAFYVPFVIAPWIFTCILSKRPINAPSYSNHQGFTSDDVRSFRNWKVAVDVLNSIASLMTIPVLSALLAQAAVVFGQRQRPGQFLAVKDLFALSDRSWTNPLAVWKSIPAQWRRNATGKTRVGSFLLPAALLILLGALQQPLYQILVSTNTIAIATCSDTVYRDTPRNARECTKSSGQSASFTPIGTDLEPMQMSLIRQSRFLPRLMFDLTSVSIDQEQPNLWSDGIDMDTSDQAIYQRSRFNYKALRPWLSGSLVHNEASPNFFVTSLQANSTTGVLREHLMRFNSSVHCEEINRTSFPSPCPGEGPFAAALQNTNGTNIRVCVPGTIGAFPWTLSRDRQDITENFYLDLLSSEQTPESDGRNISATIHCEAKTTRGYFELGNLYNNNTYSPLLDQWPTSEQMEHEFNDWVNALMPEKGFIPTKNDSYTDGDGPHTVSDDPKSDWKTSGPLLNSARALFGNTSWLHNTISFTANTTYEDAEKEDLLTWQRMCTGMPFGNVFFENYRKFQSPGERCRSGLQFVLDGVNTTTWNTTSRMLLDWMYGFTPQGVERSINSVEALLQISLFAANRALITTYSQQVDNKDYTSWRGRTIFSSPGHLLQKPVVPKSALIVISILIGLQMLGLAYLAYYVYRVPTWTDVLDSMAMARIGATLAQHDVLPPIGPVTHKDIDALKNVDGLIGVVAGKDGPEGQQTRLVSNSQSDTDVSEIEMGLVGDRGTYTDAEKQNQTIQLGLGAAGVITSDSTATGLSRRRKDTDVES